ncbi:hypothetical protein ZWY2020_049257 [Hordeum vulgare]|nr:hypothetical protein ZWY2020_049257 [Hordeum vulgare]
MSASSPPPADAAAETEATTVAFYCYECQATVSVPAPAATPSWLLLCPRCRSGFLEDNPNPSTSSPPPPPPPPPGFLSDSSEEPEDLDLGIDHTAAQAYLTRIVRRLYDDPASLATAAAEAVSVLQQHGRIGGRGQPPAPAASIAAVPTVEVSEPASVCAICKDDLPLAVAARRLPAATSITRLHRAVAGDAQFLPCLPLLPPAHQPPGGGAPGAGSATNTDHYPIYDQPPPHPHQ